MIPEWAEIYLGAEGVAEIDPRSGEPVAWGRQVTSQMPEGLFDRLRGEVEMVCVFPDWFVIERRLPVDDVIKAHGAIKAVGIGPSGGYKWMRLGDDSMWGHKSFRDFSMREVRINPRLVVKCDKDGYEKGTEFRVPRVAVGYKHGGKKR